MFIVFMLVRCTVLFSPAVDVVVVEVMILKLVANLMISYRLSVTTISWKYAIE